MTKELEALTKLKKSKPTGIGYEDWNNLFKDIKQALQRLEAIDNAKPSEVMERTSGEFIDGYPTGNINVGMTWEEHSAIKQALLKSQELETMANEYDLQPSQIREALLVFGMMQRAGYKLSDIEKAQEQEKVLKIIKIKDVNIQRLRKCINFKAYNNGLPKKRQLTLEEFVSLNEVLE